MGRSPFRIAVAALIVLSGALGASAADITIDNKEYAQLPADNQEKLVGEMKKQGLLDEGDRVVNKAKPVETEALGSGLLLTLIPGVCKAIAERKKQDDLAKCAGKPDAAAQEKCKADVEGKFGTIGTVCSAIKLF